MAIIRAVKKDLGFTAISNKVFQRNQLSFQAMGLLCYLLSKPSHWQVSPSELQKVTHGSAKRTGRDGIYAILKELKNIGFITATKKSDGTLDYYVHDEPVKTKPNTDKPEQATPNTDKPDQANPDLAKPTQVNTDLIVNTERDSNTHKSVKSKRLDFSVFNGITPDQITQLKSIRRHANGQLTQKVLNILAKEFAKCNELFGWSVGECLDQWEFKGWRGFSCEWFQNGKQKTTSINTLASDYEPPSGFKTKF